MVEVGFHLPTSSGLAIPMDGDHTQLGGDSRLRWDGAGRRIRLHGGHEDFRPLAKLVRIRRNSPDAHLDLSAAIQAAEANLRLIGGAGGMPWRTVHVLAPLNGVIADFDGGVVRGFGHGGPRSRGQTMRETVAADIGISLHHKAEWCFRHSMVTIGRGGRATLASGQCRATRDAFYLLRLAHGSVVLDVIQSD